MAGKKMKRVVNPRKRRTVIRVPANFPTSSTSYKGPIVMPSSDTTVQMLLDNATITVSAGGALLANFNNSPASARNWSELSTSWAEYRTLGVRYTYDPIATVNTTLYPGFSGYSSIVHGLTAPAATTLAQAASTGVARPFNAFKKFTREWRMTDPDESNFIPTSGPGTNSYTLSLYIEGGGVSIYYGNLLIQYLVQFRTHTL
jgi:hypothetical protein